MTTAEIDTSLRRLERRVAELEAALTRVSGQGTTVRVAQLSRVSRIGSASGTGSRSQRPS